RPCRSTTVSGAPTLAKCAAIAAAYFGSRLSSVRLWCQSLIVFGSRSLVMSPTMPRCSPRSDQIQDGGQRPAFREALDGVDDGGASCLVVAVLRETFDLLREFGGGQWVRGVALRVLRFTAQALTVRRDDFYPCRPCRRVPLI